MKKFLLITVLIGLSAGSLMANELSVAKSDPRYEVCEEAFSVCVVNSHVEAARAGKDVDAQMVRVSCGRKQTECVNEIVTSSSNGKFSNSKESVSNSEDKLVECGLQLGVCNAECRKEGSSFPEACLRECDKAYNTCAE